MKKLLLFFLALVTVSAFAQRSDTQLNTQINSQIRSKSTFNPSRTAAVLDSLVKSKQSKFVGGRKITETTYTITDADAYQLLDFTNVSGCTVTMPASINDSLMFNFRVHTTAGNVIFVGSGGSTFDTVSDTIKTPGQAATWYKYNATEWWSIGALGNASGGGGGSGAWADLTGEPTDNTDLVTYIDAVTDSLKRYNRVKSDGSSRTQRHIIDLQNGLSAEDNGSNATEFYWGGRLDQDTEIGGSTASYGIKFGYNAGTSDRLHFFSALFQDDGASGGGLLLNQQNSYGLYIGGTTAGQDKIFLSSTQTRVDAPFVLGSYPTGSLPAAASHTGAIAFDTSTGTVKYSNGSSWQNIDSGGGGGSGTVTDVTGSSPIVITGTSTVTPNVTINNAAADGSTKGAASFSATYFDATSGNISPDLTNGLASGSQSGYLSSTDWSTFNGKQAGDSDLTSWASVTRASGFDTWVATPSYTNLTTLLTGTSPWIATSGSTTVTTPKLVGNVQVTEVSGDALASNTVFQVNLSSGKSFRIRNNAGSDFFRVDDTGTRIRVGTGSSTGFAPANFGTAGVSGTGWLFEGNSLDWQIPGVNGTANAYFRVRSVTSAFTPQAAITTRFAEFTASESNSTQSGAEFVLARFGYTMNNTGGSTVARGVQIQSTETALTSTTHYPFTVQSTTGLNGIGTETPTSTFQVNGSFSAAYVAKTANYTLTVNDHIVECTANSFTITLPTAVGITGREYIIDNSGAGTITMATTSSQTIDGASPGSVAAGSKLRVYSNGANWRTY